MCRAPTSNVSRKRTMQTIRQNSRFAPRPTPHFIFIFWIKRTMMLICYQTLNQRSKPRLISRQASLYLPTWQRTICSPPPLPHPQALPTQEKCRPRLFNDPGDQFPNVFMIHLQIHLFIDFLLIITSIGLLCNVYCFKLYQCISLIWPQHSTATLSMIDNDAACAILTCVRAFFPRIENLHFPRIYYVLLAVYHYKLCS